MLGSQLFLTQQLKNIAYNFKYKALAYFEQCNRGHILNEGQKLYILGNKFQANKQNLQSINKKIYQIFSQTIWLTYRSGFPQLNEQNTSSSSDRGWGCMIRVGQMLFAQIIKQHKKASTNEQIQKIVGQFNDFNKETIFSIQNIIKKGLIQYNLIPGQWYNPSQVSFILKKLFNLKQKSQYENLDFKVFLNGTIYFDQIIRSMMRIDNRCSCLLNQNQIICAKCNTAQKSIGMIILTRVGVDKPQKRYLNIVNKLMELKQFQGIIGGKPGKALYFLGRHEEDYIYLDPHYVQKAKSQIKQTNSYFCQSFRKCKNNTIDSSMGINYYIRDFDELNSFYQQFIELKKSNPQNFFLSIEKQTPIDIQPQQILTSFVEQDIFQQLDCQLIDQ